MDKEMSGGGPMVVGIFDDTYQAEIAIDELKKIGIPDDRIDFAMSEESSVAGSYTAGEEPLVYGKESSQAIVSVRAEERRQEVIDLLHRYGAYDVRGAETEEAEAIPGSSYDAARDRPIDASSPRRVTDAGTYNVKMGGTGEVETGASGGRPTGSQGGGSRWEDMTSYYRSRWQQRYGTAGRRWEDYEPAYRYGWEKGSMPSHRGRAWSDVEPELRTDWETQHHESPWSRVVDAVRDAWEHITGHGRSDADRAA